MDDHPPIKNKRAYLYRLTADLAIDHGKVETRRARLHADVARLQGDDEAAFSGEDAQTARDELRRIADAVRTLSPRAQQVFVLSRIEGVSQRDIAARLGVSKPTVEKDLARPFQAIMGVLQNTD